jgi:hypothetical protein
MIKFNTIAIKNPSDFEVNIIDVVKVSDRNALGQELVDRVAQKRQVSIEWTSLTQTEITEILGQINNVFVTMEYPDPELSVVSKEFRVMSRQMPKAMYRKGTEVVWESLSVELSER